MRILLPAEDSNSITQSAIDAGWYALEQTHDDNYGCFAAQAAGVMFAMRWMDAFARPGRMSAR